MNEPLHPSSLSEILDRTAQLYRSRFLVFFGIAMVPAAALLIFAGVVVLLMVQLGTGNFGTATLTTGGILAVAALAIVCLVALPVLLATTALATAAMNQAASRTFLGQTATIRDSYKTAWRRGWQALGLYIFQLVAVWVLPIGAWTMLLLLSAGMAALAQSLGMAGGGLFLLAGFLIFAALVVYGFWMSLRLSLAFPAYVVEQIGPWDAPRRSAVLTRGTKGRILLLYLLGVALNWLLSMAITLPLTLALALLPGAGTPQHAQTAGVVMLCVVYGAAFIVQALTRPVYGIALVLFYYDQRIRQEAFDIEWMMAQAGLIVPEPAPNATQAWTTAISAHTQAAPAGVVPVDLVQNAEEGNSSPVRTRVSGDSGPSEQPQ